MGINNRRFMRKIAAIVTAAAIIVPQAAIYADPEESDMITGSGAAEIIGTPSENNEAIGDDNAYNSGNAGASEDSSSEDLTNTTVGNDTADDERENISYENDASNDNTVTSEATAEPTATPEPKQTRLVNGDFEYPQIYETDFFDVYNGTNSLNGPWYVASRDTLKSVLGEERFDLDKFGWHTTAKDQKIELVIGKTKAGGYVTGKKDGVVYGDPNNNKTLYNNVKFEQICGRQYAELCGEDQSSLYQVISTKEGTVFDWKLKHRSCEYQKEEYKNIQDTMALFIGDASCIKDENGEYEKILQKKYAGTGNGCNDIFMWMAQLLKDNNLVEKDGDNIKEKNGTNREFTIYSTEKIPDSGNITKDNYKDYFSLTPKGGFKKEWKCWIISNGNTAWGTPSGTYSVAEGQKESIFAFTALSGGKSGSSQTINQGNLLDDVEFSASYPLKVSSTGGGSGTVVINDNDYKVDAEVGLNKTHDGIYMEDTAVKVTAKANTEDSCRFLGANIGGKFYSASDTSRFTEESDGTYTLSFSLDEPTYIHLMFAKSSTVIYDPNGGTYRGQAYYDYTMGTEGGGVWNIHENKNVENNGDAMPKTPEDTNFIGWFFSGAGSNGGIITSDHIITYKSDGTDTNKDTLEVQYKTSANQEGYNTVSVPASEGIAFVAQYEYRQKAVVMVKDTTDYEYKEDVQGSGATGCTVQVGSESGITAGSYHKVAETVSMKAVRDKLGNYIFMGWYDAPNGGNKISDKEFYTYSVDGPRVVYARFSRRLQFPYLSFVAEDNEKASQSENTTFNIGSHIRVGDTVVSAYDDENVTESVDNESKSSISNNHIGGSYGNTISTGFVANLNQMDENVSVKSCIWKIEIPVKDTYIKSTDSSSWNFKDGKTMSFEDTPVFEDSENVEYNNGSIYKVKNINNSADEKVTLTFKDKLPAIVTGSIVITYGLVIDNLYAPGAEATMAFDEADSAETIDLSQEDGTDTQIHTGIGKLEDYITSKNNPYNN